MTGERPVWPGERPRGMSGYHDTRVITDVESGAVRCSNVECIAGGTPDPASVVAIEAFGGASYHLVTIDGLLLPCGPLHPQEAP